jgi:hypothetical protein
MSDEETRRKNREYLRKWRAEHPEKLEERAEYARERRKKGLMFRYVYPNCEKVDCDWVEAQLEDYRKEHENDEDTDKHEEVHQKENKLSRPKQPL